MRQYPPPHLLQRASNSSSAEVFASTFEHLRYTVKKYLSDADLDFAAFESILDLGCGVGRFLYTFEKEFRPTQRVYACEVHQESAAWCQANLDLAEVSHTDINPPLPYADGQFDFVYALSVFTHLNLDLQFRWAWEIHRILKPGGVAFLTTHGQIFIPLFFQAYLDSASARSIVSVGDEGLFGYMRYVKDAKEGQEAVASAQNLEFVREQFAPFRFLKVYPKSDLAGEQDLYILQKTAGTIARPLQDAEPLRFNLSGQSNFKVYVRDLVPDICALDCRITIEPPSGKAHAQTVPLNIQRLFGPSHYLPVALTVPHLDGDCVVHLSCLRRDNGKRRDVEWNFPHFY